MIFNNNPYLVCGICGNKIEFYACNTQTNKTGWICPKCGIVNSPCINQCPCQQKVIINKKFDAEIDENEWKDIKQKLEQYFEKRKNNI